MLIDYLSSRAPPIQLSSKVSVESPWIDLARLAVYVNLAMMSPPAANLGSSGSVCRKGTTTSLVLSLLGSHVTGLYLWASHFFRFGSLRSSMAPSKLSRSWLMMKMDSPYVAASLKYFATWHDSTSVKSFTDAECSSRR